MNNLAVIRRRRGFLVGASILSAVLVMASLAACDPDPVPIVANPPNKPSGYETLIPLYGLTDQLGTAEGPTAKHFYTTDPTERDDLRKTGDWHLDPTTGNCDGIVGYVYDRSFSWPTAQADGSSITSSTVPLLRFENEAEQTYDYVSVPPDTTLDAVTAAEASHDFTNPRTIGYVLADRDVHHGTEPSLIPQEDGKPPIPADADPVALTRVGSDDEGTQQLIPVPLTPLTSPPANTVAWVVRAPVPVTVNHYTDPYGNEQRCPVTRLTAAGHSFLTTDIDERAAKLADREAGWTLAGADSVSTLSGDATDGVIGYTWSLPDGPTATPVDGTELLTRYVDTSGDYRYALAGAEVPGFSKDGPSADLGYAFSPPTAAAPTLVAPGTVTMDQLGDRADGQPGAFTLFTSVDDDVPYYQRWPAKGVSAPNGTMVAIHGGGWHGGLVHVGVPLAVVPSMFSTWSGASTDGGDSMVDRYTRLGWDVYTVDYDSGGQRALAQVKAFYEDLRSRLDPGTKVCAAGDSAGGHLALMLAATEPSLTCAISLDGPTDLPALDDHLNTPGAPFRTLVPDAFGPESSSWSEQSPVAQVAQIRAKTLVVTSSDDPIVPPTQAGELRTAAAAFDDVPTPNVWQLTSGAGHSWVHDSVTQASFDIYTGVVEPWFLTNLDSSGTG